ncbi:hypothetical protein [Pseudonocardia sp. MH-G8]|uniref:hypothetical protein n=1 Tax=Pseudonocardia sp. MH-G8 TaxID=1854588 RepID=UPI00117B5B01|nr:hypothetical protein [Pseudonocardia sp. MH-G8]
MAGSASSTSGEDPAAVASPTPTADSTDPPGGAYRYVEGLCKRIDFSMVEALAPFSGEVTGSGRYTVPFSSANCSGTNEANDDFGGGSTRVDVQWLPTPRLAAAEFENMLSTFSGTAEQVAELPGRWEHAVQGTGNGINDTAASILVQDSNLVVRVEIALALVQAQDRAGPTVQSVAESVLSLSAEG